LFTITVETIFSASHQLTLADGSKEPLHEHDWKVRVAVSAAQLDETGLVMDFYELRIKIAAVLVALGGVKLEDVPYFADGGINASAETVSQYIYDNLASILPDNVELSSIEVMEQPDCWAKYSK
jgi:6-pyruvoyltetrahydropterin/6-carboxytetrahydropterin synthase